MSPQLQPGGGRSGPELGMFWASSTVALVYPHGYKREELLMLEATLQDLAAHATGAAQVVDGRQPADCTTASTPTRRRCTAAWTKTGRPVGTRRPEEEVVPR